MRWASEKDKTAYIKGETWKFKPVSYFLHTSKYIFFKETRIVSKDFSLNLKKKKKISSLSSYLIQPHLSSYKCELRVAKQVCTGTRWDEPSYKSTVCWDVLSTTPDITCLWCNPFWGAEEKAGLFKINAQGNRPVGPNFSDRCRSLPKARPPWSTHSEKKSLLHAMDLVAITLGF